MKMFILGAIVATAVVAIMPLGTAIVFGAGLAVGYVIAKAA
jgi:hypothetical protein